MNSNLHKIYAPLVLATSAAAFAHPVLNKNECIHHVVCYSCCLLFPLHSFYLRIHRKSFVKLVEREKKLSRPHYIKFLVFLQRRIIPANTEGWKINWPKNAVAFTFRPFGIARRLDAKTAPLPFFNNADCPGALMQNEKLCARAHMWGFMESTLEWVSLIVTQATACSRGPIILQTQALEIKLQRLTSKPRVFTRLPIYEF